MNKTLAAQLRERFNQAEAERIQLELKKKAEAIANAANQRAEIERAKIEANAVKIAARRELRKKLAALRVVKTAYLQILKAITKGNSITTMLMSPEIHPEELLTYGLKADRPKEVEEKLNGLQRLTLHNLEELLTKEKSDEARLLRPIMKIHSTLSEIGILAGIEPAAAEIAKIEEAIDVELKQLDKACVSLKEAIATTTREIKSTELARKKQMIALEKKLGAIKEKKQNTTQRAELIQQIANDIAPRMPTIANDFNVAHPDGQALSVLARASFLRRSFAKIDPNFNQAEFSDLEVINIARIANGQEPLPHLARAIAGQNASEEWSSCRKEAFRRPESIEQRFTRQFNKHNNELSSLRAQLVANTEHRTNLRETLRKLIELSKTLAIAANDASLTLGQINSKAIRFVDGQYFSKTTISLSNTPPNLESPVRSSYDELVWLSSADGKIFLEYLQVVLLELANKSQRTAEIAFAEVTTGATELAVGGVKLSARLRKEVIMLIFKCYGLSTMENRHTSTNGSLEVSW